MKSTSLLRLVLLLTAASAAVFAQYPKLDAALSDIVDAQRGGISGPVTNVVGSGVLQANSRLNVYDAQGRILVDIYLDGSVSANAFAASLTQQGALVTGVNPYFSKGAVSAYVPTASLIAISNLGGLNVMVRSARPEKNVGAATSGGTRAIRSDVANTNGFTGAGITVGVLSDSYDTSTVGFSAIRAANDIASGDLPTPKYVVDLPTSSDNTDEGRGMMQIVYDVAPASSLCFATAFAGEAAFAANIRDLRTNAACRADVIVDDVFYFDEPFFSDGQVAEAVNDVVTSNVLAGRKVAYFSSAGNQGSLGGYGAINVPNATFSTSPTGLGNINLATAATCTSSPSSGSTKADVAGGWLDFGGGTYALPLTYFNGGSQLILQWDDLFYQSPSKITTDLNWYMFNSSGSCVFAFAGNNFTSNAAIEVPGLSGGSSGTYRIMVARTSAGTQLASRVKMVNLGGWGGAAFLANSPSTFGHSAAANGISVAAYRYTSPASQQSPVIPAIEAFTSPGPVTIAFNASGTRLAIAETRKKPDIAAPDGGNTTFFYPGQDFEGDSLPNFFGTSAAAPHAAGVAALMLQKAGGPGSLTPPQIKSILQTTSPARVLPNAGGSPVKGYNVYDGFGLIDAVLALAKISAPI
jgi:hypothetical protein